MYNEKHAERMFDQDQLRAKVAIQVQTYYDCNLCRLCLSNP